LLQGLHDRIPAVLLEALSEAVKTARPSARVHKLVASSGQEGWTSSGSAALGGSRDVGPGAAGDGAADQSGEVSGGESLETFDYLAIPSLNKKLVVELARASGSDSGRTCWRWQLGTGKTHLALALGLGRATAYGYAFTTAAALVHD